MGYGGNNNDSSNILSFIKPGSIGAEIGVWKGGSSKKFIAKKLAKFYMVDPWAISGYQPAIDANDNTFSYEAYLNKYSKQTGGKTPEAFQKFYDKIYAKVYDDFSKITNVEICRMSSTEWFDTYSGDKLDWVYIDGDHSYTGVITDLTNCIKVLKPNGIILGDDYKWHTTGDKGGVKKAVNEFVEKYNYTLEKHGKIQFSIIR